jgi:hypothetical protein
VNYRLLFRSAWFYITTWRLDCLCAGESSWSLWDFNSFLIQCHDAKCALNHQSNPTLMFLTEGIKIIMETFLQCNCEANLQRKWEFAIYCRSYASHIGDKIRNIQCCFLCRNLLVSEIIFRKSQGMIMSQYQEGHRCSTTHWSLICL